MSQIEQDSEETKYFWCMFCERTYQRGEFRLVEGKEMCPYESCVGDTDLDSREWDLIRVGREDRYPEIPVRGKIYPQYEPEIWYPG